MKESKYIWKNNELIPWAEATTHVLTHGLHYGTGVFEGIRVYNTAKGPAVFQLPLHIERLFDSALIYKMPMPYTKEEITDGLIKLVKENELTSCYVRPIVYRGYGVMGLNPKAAPVDVVIAAYEWGTYLGEDGLENGIRAKISTWKRIDSQILPALAKCTANYANSVLAKTEAIESGYDEALMLNLQGNIAEGPGENIFMIKENKIYTPPISDSILMGITALSVIEIAKDLGYEVISKTIKREELFIADELFFTGTAAEVTPIREIDGYQIGLTSKHAVTKKIQGKFFEIVEGKNEKYSKWLTFI